MRRVVLTGPALGSSVQGAPQSRQQYHARQHTTRRGRSPRGLPSAKRYMAGFSMATAATVVPSGMVTGVSSLATNPYRS